MWLAANVACCFIRSDIELHFRYHWFNVHGIGTNLNLIQYNFVCVKVHDLACLLVVSCSGNILE